jgi:uncharacterized protein (TIGR00369 family)
MTASRHGACQLDWAAGTRPGFYPPKNLEQLQYANSRAEFNKWCGIEVTAAEEGFVELSLQWKKELGQYSGFLHAGLIGALIDTACGFAAATVVGPKILASNFSVNCLRPAIGERFIARAKVVKPGKKQTFTSCDLFAITSEGEKLVANGQALLCLID